MYHFIKLESIKFNSTYSLIDFDLKLFDQIFVSPINFIFYIRKSEQNKYLKIQSNSFFSKNN